MDIDDTGDITPLERKRIAAVKAYARKQENYHFDMVAYRISEGLPKIMSGNRSCIRCDREFFSDDLRCERMCKDCREVAVRISDGF